MTKHEAIQPQETVRGVQLNATPAMRPITIDGCDTIPKLFQARCLTLGPRTAHREKDLGIWQSFSWADYWQHAKWIGLALMKLGVKRGEVVSILSEDRKEWLYFDMGIQGVGGLSTGVYTTDSSSQLAYILKDSASRVLVVENEEQLDKFLEIPDGAPGVEHVIILEREGLHDLTGDRFLFIDQLSDIGRAE